MAGKVTDQVPIEETIQNYRAAVAENPSDPQTHLNLGWGLHYANMLDEAQITFQRALDLDLNLLDAYYGLGLTYKRLKKTDQARSAFEKVISLTDQSEDQVRGKMLKRLAAGHVHKIDSGDWGLGSVSRLG